jgi:CPA1 family monovalent cation:H+ antiporter
LAKDVDAFGQLALRLLLQHVDVDDKDMARSRDLLNIERRLRVAGLKAARDELYGLRRTRRIEDEALRRMVREIDLAEKRYTT